MSMEAQYAPLPRRQTPDAVPIQDKSTVVVVPSGLTIVVENTIELGAMRVECDSTMPANEIHFKQRGIVVAKITNLNPPEKK